jgi:hypothetical protein
MNKEIAIYATLYNNNLDLIEHCLNQILKEGEFNRIEQKTVLIYEDSIDEFSIEPDNDTFYLSGRIKESLLNGENLIINITDKFKEMEIEFSLDYQEEENGEITSPEYNISNKIQLNR